MNKLFATAALAVATGVAAPAANATCGTTSCGQSSNTYVQNNTQNTTNYNTTSNAVSRSDSNATSNSVSNATGGNATVNMAPVTATGGQGGQGGSASANATAAGGQGGQGGTSSVSNAGNSSVENKVKSTVLGVGSPAVANVANRCGDVIRGTSFTLSVGTPVFGIGGGVGQTTREISMPELEKCIAKEYLLAADTETRCIGLEAHREIFTAYQQENPEARPSALVTAYERRNICAAQPFAAAAVATPVPAPAAVQNNWVESQKPTCPKGTHLVWDTKNNTFSCVPN